MENKNTKTMGGRWELFLASLGALVCITITLVIWLDISQYQGTWLLPGSYFLELMAGGVICWILFLTKSHRASLVSWIYSGLITGFMILASFSVGFLFLPVFLLFFGLSIYSDIKNHQKVLIHLGAFLVAAIVQAGLMVVIVGFYAR